MNILDIIQDCLNLSYVNGLSIKEITIDDDHFSYLCSQLKDIDATNRENIRIAAPNGTVIIKPENKGNKE